MGAAHVYLGAQRTSPVGEFAGPHPPEEVEALLHRALPVGAFPTRPVGCASHLIDLFGGVVAHEGLASADELQGVLVQRLEVVGGIEGLQCLPGPPRLLGHHRGQVEVLMAVHQALFSEAADGLEAETVIRPAGDEPGDVLGDGVDVFHVFFGGVGVVHAQVASTAELAGDAEVETDGLGVADVEITVGLGREAGDDRLYAACCQVLLDDLADEVLTFLRLRILGGLIAAVGLPVRVQIHHRLPFHPVRRPAGAHLSGSVPQDTLSALDRGSRPAVDQAREGDSCCQILK